MWVFELDNYRNSILCSTHRFSISPESRIYILFQERERKGGLYIHENRGMDLAQHIPPQKGEGDSGMIRNSCENSTESQLQDKE